MKAEFIEKIYAGWLAKIIGIRYGAPIEGWTYEKIKNSGVYCRDMAGLLLSGSLSAVGERKRKTAELYGGHGDGMDYGLPAAGFVPVDS